MSSELELNSKLTIASHLSNLNHMINTNTYNNDHFESAMNFLQNISDILTTNKITKEDATSCNQSVSKTQNASKPYSSKVKQASIESNKENEKRLSEDSVVLAKNQCPVCKIKFSSLNGLHQHAKTVNVCSKEKNTNIYAYKCDVQNCGKLFESEKKVQEHKKRKHQPHALLNPQQNCPKCVHNGAEQPGKLWINFMKTKVKCKKSKCGYNQGFKNVDHVYTYKPLNKQRGVRKPNKTK